MLIKHPTREGYLIATPEIIKLSTAIHRLIFPPDETQYHPLHFTPADITTLDQAKSYATEFVKRKAEEKRGEYITLKPGKMDEYAMKRDEYRSFVAAGKPAAPAEIDYPIASSEAQAWGITTRQMLVVWGAKLEELKTAYAVIAKTERQKLKAVEDATTIEGVAEVLVSLAA